MSQHFETRQIHAGTTNEPTNSVTTPIYQTTAYTLSLIHI